MTDAQVSLDGTKSPKANRWRRACFLIVVLWTSSSMLLSTSWFRAWVSYPLHVSNMTTKAEIAYVMSDGHAYWNRLYAASDLYHMGLVAKIAVQENSTSSRYDFVSQQSQTVTQRAIRYLEYLGVPEDHITTVRGIPTAPLLGTWSEAQGFATEFPDATNMVVVTSSPHTRRSLLCFQRAMPSSCRVSVHADSLPAEGAELFVPIWVEYGKLAVYWLVAGK